MNHINRGFFVLSLLILGLMLASAVRACDNEKCVLGCARCSFKQGDVSAAAMKAGDKVYFIQSSEKAIDECKKFTVEAKNAKKKEKKVKFEGKTDDDGYTTNRLSIST